MKQKKRALIERCYNCPNELGVTPLYEREGNSAESGVQEIDMETQESFGKRLRTIRRSSLQSRNSVFWRVARGPDPSCLQPKSL